MQHFRSLTQLRLYKRMPNMRFRSITSITILCCAVSLFAQVPAKRLLKPDDIFRTRHVSNPQVSPDGNWIAYTVASVDREADKRSTALWMVNWEGTQNVQLTHGPRSASSPRWSPDG